MAPRGRRKKAGLMREDAARDRMRGFGFHEHVISESIKELLEVYEDQWFLIEDDSYGPLLAICLEKQEEKEKQLAEVQANQLPENHNEEMAEEEQPNQLAVEIHEEEKEQEQDMHIEYGRDQADELSINSEAVNDPSPAAIHLGEASSDYAQSSVRGNKSFFTHIHTNLNIRNETFFYCGQNN
ncbi:Nucleolar histone methyltransferase-related protein [Arabidopsis thaliana]|uniref:Nucleolar histone methyltransferase-related protein n=1 Tax=Arabidopsis thaliana TaxID=3702 RepID=F4IG36_ARATH|nr:Nucleolar histone methyltransferase-related protein [Arabidopsis thaliana]AEC09764.1 Nucleolar histone methyltransferase-related protein [Arabidopsis thaliana]|eukprot:NP_973643.1 Nucleolar histone methyltransferase-related protein [Arabidopsis thaliana]